MCEEEQERKATTLTRSSSSLVQTASGDVHYVKKFTSVGVDDAESKLNVTKSLSSGSISDAKSMTKRSSIKKRLSRSESEGNLALQRVADQVCLTQQLPTFGEDRYIYLDMRWTKFGFTLQSYGRQSDQKKVIVQSVAAGSPAFMAGLHVGDCIIEVNGKDVRHASVEEIFTEMMSTTDKRVQLLVNFIDGARQLELKKRTYQLQNQLSEKQHRLKELLATKNCMTTFPGYRVNITQLNKPRFVFLSQGTTNDATSIVSTPESSSNCSNDAIKVYTNIGVYTDKLVQIICDVLIIPFDHGANDTESELLAKFIQSGGDKLMNELALASNCKVGNFMITSGGEMRNIKSIYHCVFGSCKQHIKSSCLAALIKCLQKHQPITAVFWLDGFLQCGVSPTLIIETVKEAVDGNVAMLRDLTIIFASVCIPALFQLVDEIFHTTCLS